MGDETDSDKTGRGVVMGTHADAPRLQKSSLGVVTVSSSDRGTVSGDSLTVSSTDGGTVSSSDAGTMTPDNVTVSSSDGATVSAQSESDLLGKTIHLALGTAWWATGPIRFGGRLAARTAEAVFADARKRSPWLHRQTQGGGADARGATEQLIQSLLRPVITRVVDAALAELDLTELILENVDLDAVAAKLDVEAVIKRVDLDGVVATVDLNAAVERVDLDRIVNRIDIDSVVAGVDIGAVIDRVDVDAIVRRVDLDGAVALVDLDAVVKRLDLNEIADGLDLDPLVAKVNLDAVVDRLDIAAVVARVDPDPVVAKVNFDAAMAQIDLIGIAQKIVDGIDLPGIIRDSTGSLASEAVHGVRVQGQQADDAVGQLVGRVFRRRAAVDGLHP